MQILIQSVWGRAWDSAFLPSSQTMLMLVVYLVVWSKKAPVCLRNITHVFPTMRSAIPNFLSVTLCFILNSFTICECISKHYVCLVSPVLKFYTNGRILCASFCCLFLPLLHSSLCFGDTLMLVHGPVVHLFLLLFNFCWVTVPYCIHPFLLL